MRWYVEFGERAAPSLTGPDRGRWLDQLEREIDNFRVALRWTIDERRLELGLRLAVALWRFWQIRAHIGEGRAVLAELLALDRIETEVDPAIQPGPWPRPAAWPTGRTTAAAAIALYERSIELRRAIGDRPSWRAPCIDLGQALASSGRSWTRSAAGPSNRGPPDSTETSMTGPGRPG